MELHVHPSIFSRTPLCNNAGIIPVIHAIDMLYNSLLCENFKMESNATVPVYLYVEQHHSENCLKAAVNVSSKYIK